jgi:hypothetical protein
MKSGQHRDKIARKEKVIGFKMEGVGVWDNVPCIIIKGVCDYADSHKSKLWQAYAAATRLSSSEPWSALKYPCLLAEALPHMAKYAACSKPSSALMYIGA